MDSNKGGEGGRIPPYFWGVLRGGNPSKSELASGYWINQDVEILSDEDVIERMAATLEKSDGDVDWDYGLLKRLSIFAEKNGEKTFKIIKHYLLSSGGELNSNLRTPFLHDDDLKKSLEVIWKNGDQEIKDEIKILANTLIEKGSSAFWWIKDVINQ